MPFEHIGARIRRLEDPALLLGHGQYIGDICLPGTLHAAFVRSLHAHATIKSIDARRALEYPGIKAVFTLDDMPGKMRELRVPLPVGSPLIAHPLTQYSLARSEVCYAGEALAVVIAESRYRAEDAVEAVEVEYDILPVAADCRDALESGAPRAHSALETNVVARYRLKYGDAESAFRDAPHVSRGSYLTHRGCGPAMENRGVLARFDPVEERLMVWSATQAPHQSKNALAELLDFHPERIRVAAPADVGGGFGPKATFYAEEAVIAACALKLGVPIRWIEDRRENFLAANQERDQYWDVALALDRDGRIRGLRGRLIHDAGAYVPWGIVTAQISGSTLPGPYLVPNFDLEIVVAFTNRVPTTPVRGAGRPQAVFAMERLMDRAARELEIDRAEIRARNFIRADQMPYRVGLVYRDGSPVIYDSGDYPRCQAMAVRAAGYGDFRERQQAALRQNRYLGIGIGNYVEGTGLGPFEGATVRILRSGKVAVSSGASPQGQGHKTTFAQICAEQLGVRIGDVTVTTGDTAAISMGTGTFASRITVNAGSSVFLASAEVRRRVLKLAAKTLEVSEGELELAGGYARVKGAGHPGLSFGELAAEAEGMPGFALSTLTAPGLEATDYFMPTQAAYSNGTHIAEVEVDIATGQVRVIRYCVVHDCGRVINPVIVEGQIQGGVAHGLGNALLERMVYDDNAQPLSANLADYMLPFATDVPRVEIQHLESLS
ncbi:MAG TPA: xanthine dehydrogenase family protein molybdopterin-binding subunit, partial [Candidatus Binataceae bacterium]|nr:xanthine dehydrogenase family protein molybdopterin-binding subunit [Candidatus Binataceae bacterium]